MNLEALPPALMRAMTQLTLLALGDNPSCRLPAALRETPSLEIFTMHVSPSLRLGPGDAKIIAALSKLRVIRFWVDTADFSFVSGYTSTLRRDDAWREGSKEVDVCDQIRWQNPLVDVQVQIK
jgi:hypothetical protein